MNCESKLNHGYVVKPQEIMAMELLNTAAGNGGGCNLELTHRIIPQLPNGELKQSLIDIVGKIESNNGKR